MYYNVNRKAVKTSCSIEIEILGGTGTQSETKNRVSRCIVMSTNSVQILKSCAKIGSGAGSNLEVWGHKYGASSARSAGNFFWVLPPLFGSAPPLDLLYNHTSPP